MEGQILYPDYARKTFGAFTQEEPVYVPEVVTEDQMWFQSVPRLGCYLAIPIVYKSCLSQDALTAATQNFFEVEQRR